MIVRSEHALISLISLLMLSACDEAPSETGGGNSESPACRLNSDCPVGQRCEAEACVPDDRPDAEAPCEGDCPCQSNGDCAGGEGCDVETGQCFAIECLRDDDCALGDICVGSRCVTDLEADRDRDGVPDNTDNCPDRENSEQEDLDGDERGDACDEDEDGDGVDDGSDNCPQLSNPAQGDANQDGIGNLCDAEVTGTNIIGQVSLDGVQLGQLADTVVFLKGREEQVSVDEAGRFIFPQVLRSNPIFKLRVARPGYAPLQIERTGDLSSADYDCGTLDLSPKRRRMSGAVALEGRDAAQGVQLILLAGEGARAETRTSSGEGGRFSTDAIPWSQTLRATFEGYQGQSWPVSWDEERARFFVTLEGGEQAPLDGEEATPLTLNRRRDAALRGSLSSPIEGYDWGSVEVSLRELDGPETAPLPVDPATQRFSGEGLAVGRYELTVNAQGHLPVNRFFSLSSGENSAGEITLIRQAGESATTLEGRVSLEGRAAHEGVRVRASIEGQLLTETSSDPTGRFSLQLAELDYRLHLSAPGYVEAEVDVRWSRARARFELDAETPFNGRLITLDRDRSAILSGTLRLNRPLPDYEWSRVALRLQELIDGAPAGAPRVIDLDEATQRFRAENIPVGFYRLEVDAPGHFSRGDAVQLQGGLLALGELTLERAPVALNGVVRLEGRGDHSGVQIRARIGAQQEAEGSSAEEGSFSLQLSRLSHQLQLSAAGYETLTIELIWREAEQHFVYLDEGTGALVVFGGGAPLFLSRSRDAEISGQLRSSVAGQDFRDAIVVLVNEVGRALIPVEPNGSFGETELATGLYGLEVDLPGHAPLRRFETLNSGPNPLGVVELEPLEVQLLGRVVTEIDGAISGLEGVSVRLRREGRLVASTTSDERGDFLFEVLPVPYQLALSRENFLTSTFELTFEGGRFTLDGEALEPERPLVLVRAPESDADSDGVIDILDNCPDHFNLSQRDLDGDGDGDECDADSDGDGLVNGLDNCPLAPNPMQEDADGRGRGAVCTLGTVDRPIIVGCGVRHQHLDARETDQLQGSCGGNGAPEVIYQLEVNAGEQWSIRAESNFPRVIYLFDMDGQEVDCVVGGVAQFDAGELSEGSYQLVIDGFTDGDRGPVDISILSAQACSTALSTELEDFAVGDTPFSVAVGDLNGDGLLDLVTANLGSSDVSVLLRMTAGGFAPQRTFAVGEIPASLALGDLNGDGLLDLVTANAGSDNISVLLGSRRTIFAPQRSFPVGDTPRAAAMGDLNGDGRLDLAVTNHRDDSVSVLFGDGSGAFAPRQNFDVGDGPDSVVIGDLNRDGFSDLMVANLWSHSVSVFLGREGDALTPRQDFPAGDDPDSMVIGDLNRDGFLDLAVANPLDFQATDSVSVLFGDGEGAFEPRVQFPVGNTPESLVMGDFNGDGFLDLVSSNIWSRNLSILLGDGEGNFVPQPAIDLGEAPYGMAVGDLNGDGLLDLAASGVNAARVSVLWGERVGEFVRQQRFDFGEEPYAQAMADLNGDGLLDLATANRQSDQVSVLLGNRVGTFGARRNFPVGSEPVSIKVGDLNGDGVPDLVTTNLADDTLSVLLGDGSGDFSPQQIFPVGDNPNDLAMGDLNGDGFLDLVTANAFSEDLSVLLGTGRGTFLPQARFNTGRSSWSVVTGDLDRDGVLDLISGSSSHLSVLFGDGDGRFAARRRRDFPTGDFATSLAIGDLNGDGVPDLSTANLFARAVSIFLGDGGGGLLPRRLFSVGNSPISLTMDDLNGDGSLDLAVVNSGSGDVSVLLGDGSGDFISQPSFPVRTGASSIVTGDLNQDGLPELLTTHPNGEVSRSGVDLISSRRFVDTATRFVRSHLSACPAATFSLREDHSLQPDLSSCRIDRLELDLSFSPESRGALSLRSPLNHAVTVLELPSDDDHSGRLRPEQMAPLARFELHPLDRNPWQLHVQDGVIDGGQMIVNRYPEDPFKAETLAPACSAEEDQPADPDFACRLEEDLLVGATLEDGDDEDLFLLEGDFDGAFLRGQIITLHVETTPDLALEVGLHAFRAPAPLAVAEERAPGQWSLDFTVPPDYSGRYFAVHVRGHEALNLDYTLRVE